MLHRQSNLLQLVFKVSTELQILVTGKTTHGQFPQFLQDSQDSQQIMFFIEMVHCLPARYDDLLNHYLLTSNMPHPTPPNPPIITVAST